MMNIDGMGIPIVVALIALSCTTHDATAQGAVRGGLWLEGGVGTGTVRNTCSGCQNVTVAYGPSNLLRAGGALSPRVLVGIEIFVLRSSDLVLAPGAAPVESENGTLGPIVIWYVGRSGFFLKGGAGLARGTFTVESTPGEPVTTERTGSSLTFGVGFDIGIMRWFALTANLGTHVSAIGDVHVDGIVIDDVIATVYEVGLGITLR
ncbi:MAG: outer membrane beta-barrel protein [Gemmatimonadota bacterium]|nr:outer membrane beta-barrel protein [Gemmatimonadota bacterium]MDH3421615.1 outer membrane beta-barrel protein [Gemmatimonadota bacterium]